MNSETSVMDNHTQEKTKNKKIKTVVMFLNFYGVSGFGSAIGYYLFLRGFDLRTPPLSMDLLYLFMGIWGIINFIAARALLNFKKWSYFFALFEFILLLVVSLFLLSASGADIIVMLILVMLELIVLPIWGIILLYLNKGTFLSSSS